MTDELSVGDWAESSHGIVQVLEIKEGIIYHTENLIGATHGGILIKINKMESLEKIYQRSRIGVWPDKGTVHTYIEVYEKILAPYRRKINFLEIGLFSGQSLRMWEQYFNEGKCWGIDCSDQPLGLQDLRPMISEGTHNIIIMDGTKESDIEKNFKDIMFDVIIDDGSHALSHQLESYKYFKPHLNKGGIYIIEDIQNIDQDRAKFEQIDSEKKVEILDRRSIKKRYDDVLVIIKDK